MALDSETISRLEALLESAREGSIESPHLSIEAARRGEPDFGVLMQVIKLVEASFRGEDELALTETPIVVEYLRNAEADYPVFLWSALNQLGIVHFRRKQFTASLNNHADSLAVADGNDLGAQANVSRVNIGLVRRHLDDSEGALAILLPVLADRNTILSTLAFGHLFAAQVYRDHAYWELELHHLYRSIEGGGNTEILEKRAMLARALVERGEAELAREVLDSTRLEDLNELSRFYWSYYVLAHGDVLTAEGKAEEALLALDGARAVFAGYISEIPIVQLQLSYARAWLGMGQPETALRMLDELLGASLPLGDQRVYVLLAREAHRALGDAERVARLQHSLDRIDEPNFTLRKLFDRVGSDARRSLVAQPERVRWSLSDRDQDDVGGLGKVSSEGTVAEAIVACVELGPGSDDGAVRRQANGLLGQLLANKGWTPKRTGFEVRSLLQARLAMFEESADRQQVSVVFEEDGRRVFALADVAACCFVLQTLFRNALAFNHRGGVVEIDVRLRGRQAIVVVSDGGRGWAPGFEAQLFEQTTVARGLPLSRTLAGRIGGRLDARSAGLDSGAVFTLTLPAITGDRAV